MGRRYPHHVVILHETFQHAAAEGQKEAERVIHQGCWQTLPQLNPEVCMHTHYSAGGAGNI